MDTLKLKCGDTREDGMVFWGYVKACKNGEWWMTTEKFLKKKATAKAYSQTPESKAVQKAYSKTPEAIATRKAQRGTPEAKDYQKAYQATPETKAYHKAYRATPDAKAAQKARNKTPEAKAKKKAYSQTTEARAAQKYYRETPAVKAATNTRLKERRDTDPRYALTKRLRGLTNNAFRNSGFKKTSKTAKILGCTWEELFTHIEKQFVEGMSWEVRHLIHIDHIIPLASASTKEELSALCHFTNLQPLWAIDNYTKSDTLPCGKRGRKNK